MKEIEKMNTILFNDENNENKKENQTMNENKSKKIVTNRGILYHPHLFEKWAYNDRTPAKYSLTFIITGDDIETIKNIKIEINREIEKAKQLFGDKVNETLPFIYPLKKTADNPSLDYLFPGCYYINVSSNLKPKVVDEKMRYLFHDSQVPNGSYGKISMICKAYNMNGQIGVSLRLFNVQVFKECFDPSEFLPNPEDDFS